MRTLNYRRLILLIAMILVVGAGTHWLHGYQVHRNVRMFLREARRAKDQNRPAEAASQLQWYLRLVPEDTAVRAELGILLADLSRRTAAYMTLEEVLRRDPLRSDVRRRLVKIAIELRRYSDARNHLEEYLLKTSPEDAELLEMLGTCQAAMGEYPQAQAALERSIALDPKRLVPYAQLASLLREQWNRPQEADAVMNRLVEDNPRSVEAHVLRGRHLAESGRYDAAIDDAKQVLELEPANLEALQLASQAALQQKQLALAGQYARRALEVQPEYPPMYMTLSAVSLGSGDTREAIAWLRRGLEAVPENQELEWNLANLLLDHDELDEAETVVQQLGTTEMSEVLLGYLRARVSYVRGQWREASRALEQLRPALKQWPELVKQADFFLGGCYEHLDNADLQLVAYRRATEVDPLWAPARTGAAAALVSLGRVDEALEEYRRIVKLDNAPAIGWGPLVRLLILNNLRKPAAERRWDDVEQVLDQAASAVPDSVQVEILRAESLVAQDLVEKADTLLTGAADKTPQSPELWGARIALAERQEDWPRVESLLDEGQQVLRDHIVLRLARAQYLVARFGNEGAPELRKLSEGMESWPDDDQRRLARQLAALALEAGDYSQAARLCRSVAEKDPNDLAIRLLGFERAKLAGDASGMEKVLAEIEQIEGRGPVWLYHRAIWLSQQARKGRSELLDEAQQDLAQARVLRPAWSDVPALAADLYAQQGSEDLAVEHYLQAIELGNRRLSTFRRAVQLLNRQQRYLEADQVIRRLEEQLTPLSTDLNRMAAEVSLRLDEFDRALILAKRAAKDSQDYGDHLWLGQVLSVVAMRGTDRKEDARRQNVINEAEQAFRRATEMDRTRPECWVALTQLLVRTGQTDRAEQVVEEARRQLPSGVGLLAMAQCYDSLGRRAEATAHYEKALAQAGNNPAVARSAVDFYLRHGDSKAAEPLLKSMIEGKFDSRQPEVQWARRNLAMALLARGDYRSLQQAAEILRPNLAIGQPSRDDLRAYALILGSDPQVERQREATQVLEKLLADQANVAAEDRFILARLYLAQNDWANASRQMRSLLAIHGNEPRYVAAHIRALIRRKEMSEAELWLGRLEKMAPEELTTADLRAEYCFERGRFEETLATLNSYLEKHVEQASDDATEIAEAAVKLETFGMKLKQLDRPEAAVPFIERAEAAYRQYAERRPEHRLVLTSFLGREKRFDEAIENLQQHWQASSPELIAAAIGTVLSHTEATSEPAQRVERVLAAAIEKLDEPVPLLLADADHRTALGRYDEAEALLRRAIAKDNSQIAAVNNLALLLALQGKKLDEARTLIDRVIETAGPKAAYLDSRASIALAGNQPKQASEDLREAIDQAPTATRYFHRALAQERMGQSKEAAETFRKAQQLGLIAERVHPLERDTFRRLEGVLR